MAQAPPRAASFRFQLPLTDKSKLTPSTRSMAQYWPVKVAKPCALHSNFVMAKVGLDVLRYTASLVSAVGGPIGFKKRREGDLEKLPSFMTSCSVQEKS